MVYGVGASAGRFQYVKEHAALFQELDLSWAWFDWRGGGGDGWVHGSSEIA